MKHFKKYWGWYALAAGIILVVSLYFIFRPTPPPAPTPGPGTPPPNLADNIANILSGIFSSAWIKNLFGGGGMADPACQSNNPGFDNNGYYTTKCGGVPGGGGANCDPANPGKDMNGFSSSQCGG